MKHDYPILAADVLIIGGGSAGAMAAIRAREVGPDQKVVIFEKGDILYSGCIARGMDALNIVALPGHETPELYVESNSIACQSIMDEPPSYVMAKRSWEMMQKLISLGVYFPQDEKGQYERLQVHPKGKFCVTMKEPELKSILANRARDLGAQAVNRTMALRLIKNGDRVAGAVGMNVRTGEIVVCLAKTVILAAGGTARFGLPENGYLYGVYDFPGNTGDGYALAPQVRCVRGQGDFEEMEGTFSPEQARLEAERCYSCGGPEGRYRTCWFCLPCEVVCPEEALWVEIPYLLR